MVQVDMVRDFECIALLGCILETELECCMGDLVYHLTVELQSELVGSTGEGWSKLVTIAESLLVGFHLLTQLTYHLFLDVFLRAG